MPLLQDLNDTGNAAVLLTQYDDDLRYVEEYQQWLQWDGQRWEPVSPGVVHERVAQLAPYYNQACEGVRDMALMRALLAHAREVGQGRTMRATARVLGEHPQVRRQAHQLDAHAGLLHIGNGVLDCTTGELKAPQKELLLTKGTPVVWKREKPGRWVEFLHQVTDGDTDFVAWLQRAIGYTLTGYTTERKFFLVYGTGRNGKTTFLNTVQALLGDYAIMASSELLSTLMIGKIRNDVARLAGARLAIVAEFEKRRLNTGLLKNLTGSDPITARFLNKEEFTFVPQCKLWVTTNHKPQVDDVEEAVWHRMCLVPFTRQIPADEVDPALPGKLMAELPGVMTWAVDGLMEWQEHGLGTCRAVEEATSEYRREEDTVKAFLTEWCEPEEGREEGVREMYDAYEWFCKKNYLQPLAIAWFGRQMASHGVERSRTREQRFYVGYRLCL